MQASRQMRWPMAAWAVLVALAGCTMPPGGTPQSPSFPDTGAFASDDVSLTRRIETVFAHEVALQGAAIRVQTANGRVQLSGTVASRAAARTAVKLALGVQGVQSVGENLRVKQVPG